VNTEYGAKEAANLVTDVMALGRQVGDSTVQADKETYFDVCCDAQGIHLFFIGIDSRTDDIVNNRVGDGGYEMYLALGENQPSYQWLFRPFKRDFYTPPWNSPHEYYRRLDDYVTLQSKAVAVTIDDKEYKGIANVMNFSWDLAYDRLPSEGSTWPFEIIRWTRGGGVTWGGKSVWQIGRWGRWKFSGLNEKAMKAIRSNIIYHALARYNAQKEPRTGGLIALWQDAELGDKTFYEKCLAGKVRELDELANLVTDNMSDETVEKLWLEAVPYWFDFQYFVSKERTKYLTNDLTD